MEILIFFQMEEYMRSNFGSQLDLPSCREESTIFEYYVNDGGEWDHWDSKVIIITFYRLPVIIT